MQVPMHALGLHEGGKTDAGRAFRQRVAERCSGTESRGHIGRAYRAGRLVCGCAHVTISFDDRLGLTQDERRLVRVRFLEPLDDTLRTELTQLVRRRGSAAHRVAERIEPIELVIDDPRGEPQRISGRLQPPQVRHRHLRDIEFGLCELQPSR